MKRNRVGILCAVLMAAAGAVGRAQAPSHDSKAGPAAFGPSRAQRPVRVGTRPNFGTDNISFESIPASDFDPDTACSSNCTDYTSTWNPALQVFDYRRYVTGGQPRLFASPRLPGGALLTYIEYDYCDNNGSGRFVFNVYICDFGGHCDGIPYQSHTSTAGEGCVAIGFNPPPFTVNNYTTRILVEAAWGVSDDTLQLAGVIVGYTLQVSPAPSVPTFNDVPVSDAAFQFIEALAASGITAGCGGGSYCPDSPLTRRQMAVFLAKALGLNWSQ
jgi:hypothetical protein